MYLKKNSLTALLAICCCICTFSSSEASSTLCSLDRMKEFAMDACEHLFRFKTEVRERRSLDYGFQRNHHYVPKQSLKHFLNIKRSCYPLGGYLRVAQEHYNKLSLLDVSPRYKPKKIAHIMHEKKLRNKREDKDFHKYSNNISYCCFNKCEEDFFC
ncbi:uncharacterized protein Ilp8 [Calliphora vicina]|uniref:uncharacterized protein Ilp8 n=1 Tax=Calliphora vicina TaxID=7373 RepID=UPI00325BE336